MKFPLALFLLCLSAGCLTREGVRPPKKEDIAGNYDRVGLVDTIERLWLKSDGRFVYEFAFGRDEPVVGDEGRWEIKDGKVVIWAHDEDGKDAAISFDLSWDAKRVILGWSSVSPVSAKTRLSGYFKHTGVTRQPNTPSALPALSASLE